MYFLYGLRPRIKVKVQDPACTYTYTVRENKKGFYPFLNQQTVKQWPLTKVVFGSGLESGPKRSGSAVLPQTINTL